MKTFLHQSRTVSPAFAFTLTELLVVIAILAVLAATQLPALTRAKAPPAHTQCMNNLRQMGRAVLLYKSDNHDAYPFGNRIYGPGTLSGSVLDPTGWPMQLLPYLGGYQTNDQPMVYLCPSVLDPPLANWVFQIHYQANRVLLSDNGDRPAPITGAMVRTPSLYWMFSDKDPGYFCNIRPGGLGMGLMVWNYPPGSPGYLRHNGGLSTVAADGHADWLRMPPYQPGAPAPNDFLELGDCSSGQNPASTWINNSRAKLFCRRAQASTGSNPF